MQGREEKRRKGDIQHQSKRTTFIVSAVTMMLMTVMGAVFGFTFGTIFVYAVGIGVLLLYIVKTLYKMTGKRVYKTWQTVIAAAFLLFFLSFVVVEALVLSEMNSDDIDVSTVDFVVVLGAGLNGTEPSLTLKNRLDAAYRFVRSHDIPVIVSGGQGKGEEISEAEAMGRYLIQKGISPQRLIYEDRSASTVQNLLFSKQIMRDKGITNPKIVIVTSDYHMFRAKFLAQRMQMDASGVTSTSPVFLRINYMIREYFAVCVTFFTGG